MSARRSSYREGIDRGKRSRFQVAIGGARTRTTSSSYSIAYGQSPESTTGSWPKSWRAMILRASLAPDLRKTVAGRWIITSRSSGSSRPRRGFPSSARSRDPDRLSSPRPSTQIHEGDVAFRRPQEARVQVPLSGEVQDKEVRRVPDANPEIRGAAKPFSPMEGHRENLPRPDPAAEAGHLVRELHLPEDRGRVHHRVVRPEADGEAVAEEPRQVRDLPEEHVAPGTRDDVDARVGGAFEVAVRCLQHVHEERGLQVEDVVDLLANALGAVHREDLPGTMNVRC